MPNLVAIAVSPTYALLAVGSTQQFACTGTMNNQQTQDLTTAATWTSSDEIIATVDVNGLATALVPGTVMIQASYQGFSDERPLNVEEVSAVGRPPVLTLAEIKLHCRIEPDQTVEDTELEQFEMAAHIHTENVLRYEIDATVGENIKQAMLMLIAHWYRSREAVTTGRTMMGIPTPFGYMELLYGERDYPIY